MQNLLGRWAALPVERREALRRLTVFLLVGGSATVTHYAVALSANRFLGLAPIEANVAGYCAAIMVSYFGHSLGTFRRPALVAHQFLRFVVISLIGLGIGQVITLVTTGLFKLPFAVGLIPVVTVVPAFTYAASSLWAFADRGHAPASLAPDTPSPSPRRKAA